MTPSPAPLRIGVIGLGGYAAVHHRDLARMEAAGEPVRVVAACDPRPAAFAASIDRWRFAPRGVAVFDDYRAMLDAHRDRLDLLVVSTPIPLHAEMHRAGVEARIPVYLEKPPTLDPDELERMIACDARAAKAALVGFNFIAEPARRALKTRLVSGEFGPLREARLAVLWPRPASYFTRNDWAGRLRADDGRLILDSCCGNAMAHYVHNLLHWAGSTGLDDWASLATVRAELRRAHAIEGADTFFIEASTRDHVTLRLALSHACHGPETQVETLVCARAEIDYVVGSHHEIRHADGRVERHPLPPFDPVVENHRAYHRYLRDEAPRPATRLADCRPFVHLHALAHISAERIEPFDPTLVATRATADATYLNVSGIRETCARFLATGAWPGDRAPAAVGPESLPRLHDSIDALRAELV